MRQKTKRMLIDTLCLAAVCASVGALAACDSGEKSFLEDAASIALTETFEDGRTFEYGGKIELPAATVCDEAGKEISYEVKYVLYDEQKELLTKSNFSTFELGLGKYYIQYTYGDLLLEKSFEVVDTIAPTITFGATSTGDMQLKDDGTETIGSLPIVEIEDESEFDMERMLVFTNAEGEVTENYPVNKMNETFKVSEEGMFQYVVTATDIAGNTAREYVTWYVKNPMWEANNVPDGNYLSDFSDMEYLNGVESGAISPGFNIYGNFYAEILEEFDGHDGVLKIDAGFNDGNFSSIRLKLGKSFNLGEEEFSGKQFVVRMRIENADAVRNTVEIAGNNISWHSWDGGKTKYYHALSNSEMYNDVVSGEWFNLTIPVAYLIELQCSAELQFIESGELTSANYPIVSGTERGNMEYFNFGFRKSYDIDFLTMYIDSICLTTELGEAENFSADIETKSFSWDSVENAYEYAVYLDGEYIGRTEENSIALGAYGSFNALSVQALSAGDFVDGKIVTVTAKDLNIDFEANGEWVVRNYLKVLSIEHLEKNIAYLRVNRALERAEIDATGLTVYANGKPIQTKVSVNPLDYSLLELSTVSWADCTWEDVLVPEVVFTAGSILKQNGQEYILAEDIRFAFLFGSWQYVEETRITEISTYNWNMNSNVFMGFNTELGLYKEGADIKYQYSKNYGLDSLSYSGSFTVCGEELNEALRVFNITCFLLFGTKDNYHYFQCIRYYPETGDWLWPELEEICAVSGYKTFTVRIEKGTRLYFKGENKTVRSFLIEQTHTFTHIESGGYNVSVG